MTFEDVERARVALYVKRQGIINKALAIGGVFIGIFILAMLPRFGSSHTSALFMLPFLLFPVIFTLAITAIILAFSTRQEAAAYKNAYKTYFVAAGLSRVFSNLTYHQDLGIHQKVVAEVMTTADRYSSNDYMTGTYKNINFTQADVHIEEKHESRDSDGHTHTTYVTIFRGRFLIFDFKRNFDFNLQVSTRRFYGERPPKSNGLKFRRIETESNEFNRSFNIYAQNGTDALYILDPAFMEKIQNLYTSCGKEFLLTFMNKKLYIAINDNNDSFEPPVSCKNALDEKAEITKVEKDTKLITNFVDSLKLDRYYKGESK